MTENSLSTPAGKSGLLKIAILIATFISCLSISQIRLLTIPALTLLRSGPEFFYQMSLLNQMNLPVRLLEKKGRKREREKIKTQTAVDQIIPFVCNPLGGQF